MRVRLRQRVSYWLSRAAIEATARLPQWLGYGVAAGLGRLYFRCSRKRQRCALEFLRAAYPDRDRYPDRELLRIGRVSTGNVCKVPIDMARLTRLLASGGSFDDVVETADFAARMPEPPFLGAAAHLGSWELGAVGVAHLAGGAHGLARAFKNPLLNRWILQNRELAGLRIHPRRGGIKPLVRAVESGHVGLQVVDQHQRLRGIRAEFFGRTASCERAVASLAVRRGYPILVGSAVRVGRGFRFRMLCQDVFPPQRTGDREADIAATVAKINRALEDMIRSCPEQYLWIHRRYRD